MIKDIEYNIINAKSEKVGATISSRYKFSRKLSLYGVYRFNEYYNTDQYTFAGDQGTNDRRINSAGVMARYSASKKLKLSSDIQATQTLYKNRLTTLENGGFNQNGLVDRATYFDTRIGFGAKYGLISIDLDQAQRRDESGGGDGNNSLGAKLALNYNMWKINLSGEYNRSIKTYTTQTETEGSDKRKDQGYAITIKLGYKVTKNFKAIASLVRSRLESNNVFGQNNGQAIGLEIGGTF
jgi:predicted porin